MGKISKTYASILILIIAMSCLTLFTAKPVNAQNEDTITINADGSISPPTAPIQQEGNTYAVKADFQGNVLIQKSNIVFNGAGRSLQGYSIKLLEVTNVTIIDLTIRGLPHGSRFGIILEDSIGCRVNNNTITDVWSFLGLNGISYEGIHVSGGSSNVFSENVLVNNSIGFYFENSANNVISKNSITYTKQSVNSNIIGISFNNAGNNTVFQNNFRTDYGGFADSYESINTWDNGVDIGNYWNGYTGNGTYVIDNNNVDHYPLSNPVDIYATPNPTPTPTPDLPRNPPHLEPIDYLLPISIIVAVVLLSVLLYRRHQKTAISNKQL